MNSNNSKYQYVYIDILICIYDMFIQLLYKILYIYI